MVLRWVQMVLPTWHFQVPQVCQFVDSRIYINKSADCNLSVSLLILFHQGKEMPSFWRLFFGLGMLQPLCLPMVPSGAERKVLGGLEMMGILKLFLSNPYNKYKGCITSSHYSPLSQAQWVPAFTCELWKMLKISVKKSKKSFREKKQGVVWYL